VADVRNSLVFEPARKLASFVVRRELHADLPLGVTLSNRLSVLPLHKSGTLGRALLVSVRQGSSCRFPILRVVVPARELEARRRLRGADIGSDDVLREARRPLVGGVEEEL